jgi:alpha-glucosidase
MNETWWKHGVVYQIYPRSFADSNGDGVGDLPGITAKLPVLADLGVDALWLSPFYPSPQKDFGYDISDFDGVDPLFGTQADFDALVAEAHRLGLKILLDLVVNHTSDQHPWFVESRSSKTNPKRDWYLWHPGVEGKAPNNWIALFEMKSAWWRDEATGEFYLGTFTRHQPELNWRHPEVRGEIYAMMRRWLDRGVDGFRLDVVNWYIKDDQLRSNPWKLSLNPPDLQVHLWDRNQPGSHEICREMRQVVEEYPGRMLVGEVYTDQAEIAAGYYGKGDELQFAFNFSFLFSPWGARAFYERTQEWFQRLPEGAWPNQTLSNHDQKRHVTRYAKGADTDARARVAAALVLLIRGTPFLYYGEEIGLRDRPMAKAEIRDPKGLMLWPFLEGRDPCRTPMPWDGTPGAGFSPAGSEAPWLPLHPEAPTRNVEAQRADPTSLWHWYRNLLALRRAETALHGGDHRWLQDGAGNVLGFARAAPGRTLEVWLNFGRRAQNTLAAAPGRVLLGSHRKAGEPWGPGATLAGYEVVVVERS